MDEKRIKRLIRKAVRLAVELWVLLPTLVAFVHWEMRSLGYGRY